MKLLTIVLLFLMALHVPEASAGPVVAAAASAAIATGVGVIAKTIAGSVFKYFAAQFFSSAVGQYTNRPKEPRQ